MARDPDTRRKGPIQSGRTFEGAGNRPTSSSLCSRRRRCRRADLMYLAGPITEYRWNDDDCSAHDATCGSGRARARFSFVRVKSSPPAWQAAPRELACFRRLRTRRRRGAPEALRAAGRRRGAASAGLLGVTADDCLVPAPEAARVGGVLPRYAVAATSNTQVDIEEDCLWDVEQEAEWRERRFLQVGGCVERQSGPPRHAIEQTPRRSMVPAQVEKEGFRDPARGNSGTVR